MRQIFPISVSILESPSDLDALVQGPLNRLSLPQLVQDPSVVQVICRHSRVPNRQRGLIHTEHKPLCRLYMMCNPFFHEFRQQMHSGSSAILLLYSPQRIYTRRLTLIGVLLTLAVGRWQWVMIYLVIEA